ncbi:MAG: glucose-1-phosphate thymidylyltransferase [Chloroflexi bacterium]|nr:glucose-1-phosphate thymidylyltransferase [Chloroflexota bacterium]MBI3734368.1 glucose-1-phosphate thymidylyltransferase [Chloroflexota bacterium]
MKGLILSGGKGTRLRPFTYTGAKQLVPVANKPVLFYAIEDLVEAGIRDIGIVIGDTGDQIRAAVGDGSRLNAQVTYIPQEAPLGLAHGVKIARGFIGAESFVLFLGDNFIRDGIVSEVRHFAERALNCQIMLHRVEHPENLGVAVLDGDRVVRLVEKPREFISNLALVGIYMFDPHIFEAIEQIKPSPRGELEITDAIQQLLDMGYRVGHQIVKGHWIDTGKVSDMLDANRLVLETIETLIEGAVDGGSKVIGGAIIEAGAQVIDSVIRGPVIIGANTRIERAFVGPFTAIGHDCLITHAEIENSIVMENSQIKNVRDRISDSLIGRFVEVSQSPPVPKTLRLMLGDHSQVGVL